MGSQSTSQHQHAWPPVFLHRLCSYEPCLLQDSSRHPQLSARGQGSSDESVASPCGPRSSADEEGRTKWQHTSTDRWSGGGASEWDSVAQYQVCHHRVLCWRCKSHKV